jgi:hypothetical protein
MDLFKGDSIGLSDKEKQGLKNKRLFLIRLPTFVEQKSVKSYEPITNYM